MPGPAHPFPQPSFLCHLVSSCSYSFYCRVEHFHFLEFNFLRPLQSVSVAPTITFIITALACEVIEGFQRRLQVRRLKMYRSDGVDLLLVWSHHLDCSSGFDFFIPLVKFQEFFVLLVGGHGFIPFNIIKPFSSVSILSGVAIPLASMSRSVGKDMPIILADSL